jgi:hypothetical protein
MPPRRQRTKPKKADPRRIRLPIKKKAPRTGRSVARIPRPRLSRPVIRAAEYCSSLLQGTLSCDPETPCATARNFQEVIVTCTVRPTTSADGDCTVVFNPHLMFTDLFTMVSQYGLNGSPSTQGATCFIPTCYAATGANSFVPIFANTTADSAPAGTANGSGVYERHIPNSAPGATSTGLSGDVRFLGGHVHFSSFETVLNTGGQLLYVHNPQDRSLIGSNFFEGTATPGSIVCVGFDSLAKTAVTNSRTACSLTQVTPAPITTVILPHTTEFEYLSASADCPDATSSAFTGTQIRGGITGDWMEQVDRMIPTMAGEVRHTGYTHAFIYIPANPKAPGVGGNCEFQFEMHYHVNVQQQPSLNSFGMTAQTALKTQGVSDARAASAMQATIDGIKQARVDNPQAVFHRPTDTATPIKNQVPSILGTVAKAAPDIASTIASMLPPGIPRTILSSVATLGRQLLG